MYGRILKYSFDLFLKKINLIYKKGHTGENQSNKKNN